MAYAMEKKRMEEQQTRLVIALSRDVFFGMRIRTVLGKLGYDLKLCGAEQDLVDLGADAMLALVDFNGQVDWEVLTPLLASATPVLAFGSHTNVEGFRAAKAAGVTRTVSNGEFSRNMPKLLEQYQR